MLKEGDIAINFALKDSEGNNVSLSDFRGKKVVLYFYPKDNTSGCTKEAIGFSQIYDVISESGAIIIGISPDGQSSHQRFKSKYNLPFILVSDEDHRISEAYGAWGAKKLYGKSYMGIIRSTYIIDENSIIKKVFSKVSPEGHGNEVLKFLNI